MDEKLLRLLSALDSKGYKKHGRATRLHEQTNYAVSTISEVLKGSAELTERFTKTVCSATGISFEWVWNNRGEMFGKTVVASFTMPVEATKAVSEPIQSYSGIDPLMAAAINLMKTWPRSKLARHVADLIADEEEANKGKS